MPLCPVKSAHRNIRYSLLVVLDFSNSLSLINFSAVVEFEFFDFRVNLCFIFNFYPHIVAVFLELKAEKVEFISSEFCFCTELKYHQHSGSICNVISCAVCCATESNVLYERNNCDNMENPPYPI